MEQTDLYDHWMNIFFLDPQADLLDFYIEACQKVPTWMETNHDDIHRFRDELAAHIRDSSYGPYPAETQWSTDEILRDLWFDVFGIGPPPGDPYPVPTERWGRHRMTTFLRHFPWQQPDLIQPADRDWLAARNLTLDDLAAYREPGAERDYLRPEPDGYRERLAELTAQGRRSGPAEGSHAQHGRADLLDAKQAYLDQGRPDLADNIDTILTNRTDAEHRDR